MSWYSPLLRSLIASSKVSSTIWGTSSPGRLPESWCTYYACSSMSVTSDTNIYIWFTWELQQLDQTLCQIWWSPGKLECIITVKQEWQILGLYLIQSRASVIMALSACIKSILYAFSIMNKRKCRLTNGMEQSPSWEYCSCSDGEESPLFLWNWKVYYSVHRSL